jgi:hypothetical protein
VNAGAALDSIASPQFIIFKNIPFDGEPYIHETFDATLLNCYGWLGLPRDDVYMVVRHEWYAEINFAQHNLPPFGNVHAWGSPLATTGIIPEAPNNYFVNMAEVVPGSGTPEGLTLRTNTYEVYNIFPFYRIGHFPPDNYGGQMLFAFTVIGDVIPDAPWYLQISSTAQYHPLIRWNASPSPDVLNYKIYRKVHGIENDWVHIGTVPANIHQFEDTQYETPHTGPTAQWTDIADYTVTACDRSAESDIPPFVSIKVVVPERPWPNIPKIEPTISDRPSDFALMPAYPNPFNSVITLKYALPTDAFVVIHVFNNGGQFVSEILSEDQKAGYHEIKWDARGNSSGVYLFKFRAGDFSQTRTVAYLK